MSSPAPKSLCRLGSLLALSLLLNGCSEPPPAAPVQQSPWAAIAKGRVSIEGGVINIAAPRAGIIREVLVEEGAEVKPGAVLARIDDREANLAMKVREQERDEARQALTLLQVKHAIAQRELQRVSALSGDEVVSKQEKDNARDQVKLSASELARQQAVVATADAQVAASKLEVDQHVVRAPLAGRIIRRQARPGDGTSTLNVTPLFMFAPNSPRIVRADLEERYVGAVEPGQAAEVTLEADETKVYKAKVLRLGQVFGNRPDNDDPNEKQDVRVIECVLALVDAPEIRIGQRVLVRIARPGKAGKP